MGLYLCVFDDDGEEVDALEVGSYGDWARFTKAVVNEIESGKTGTVCPTLTLHHDSDGSWSPSDCQKLSAELVLIERKFRHLPPIPFEPGWMSEVVKESSLSAESLYDSFIDIEGDSLIARLMDLCEVSIRTGNEVVFQ